MKHLLNVVKIQVAKTKSAIFKQGVLKQLKQLHWILFFEYGFSFHKKKIYLTYIESTVYDQNIYYPNYYQIFLCPSLIKHRDYTLQFLIKNFVFGNVTHTM